MSVPVCLNVMSIYFNVNSLQVCLSSARERAPAPTDTSCNLDTETLWKKHMQYMYFTVTNHSDDSHLVIYCMPHSRVYIKTGT